MTEEELEKLKWDLDEYYVELHSWFWEKIKGDKTLSAEERDYWEAKYWQAGLTVEEVREQREEKEARFKKMSLTRKEKYAD